MNALTRFSMKNAGLIFLAVLLVFAGGFYSVSTMKMEQLPNVDIPYMGVQVVYPGATPEQVLQDVGQPIEQQLATLQDMKNLYVTSSANYAYVTMEFEMSKSMDEAEQEVNAALAKVKLPETAKKPEVHKSGPSQETIFSFAIDGGGADQQTVQEYVEQKIKPQLEPIEGVNTVEVSGSSEKKLWVKVDPDKLKEHNLTLDKVKQALLANNVSAPTGSVTLDGKSMNVQVGKQLKSVEEVKNVNLILVEQNMSGMTDAFKSVGDGMGQLGQAVGGMGQAVGALGKNQALMQQEIQLMAAINQASAQMMQDQALLSQQMQVIAEKPQMAQDPGIKKQMADAQASIKTQQDKITGLQAQLAGVLEALKASGAESQQVMQNLQQQSGGQTAAKPQAGEATVAVELKTLKLSDIADVTYEAANTASYSRMNGQPAVTAAITPSVGANVVDIVKQVKEKLDGLTLPDGYKITELRDQSIEIKKSVNTMLREALFGALLAAVVTLLFLRNMRTTIVALLSIPLSILVTMIVMKMMDYSLNMMTLAGIAVAVGRVVDDSIVVIENIYRRILLSRAEERDDNFVLIATQEVSQAITSSTVTTIAVFGPLAFVPGIVGKFFAPFAWSVVIALAFSLLIAVTLVPLLSRMFLMNLKPVEHKENWLQTGYKSLLEWSLDHKTIVVVLSLALLGGTGFLVTKVDKNFFPQEKAIFYTFTANLPIGTAVEKSNEVAKKVESLLADRKDVKNYTARVDENNIRLRITLNDDVDQTAFENEIREQTKNLGEGVETALAGVGGPGGGGNLFMVVNGPDLESIKKAANDFKAKIGEVEGLADVKTNIEGVRPQVTISVDDVKAAEQGLNPAMIMMAVRDMLGGSSVTNVVLDGKTTDVNLGLKVDGLKNLDTIAQQKLSNMKGDLIAIGDVAKVEQTTGATSIQRLNQQEYVSVSAKITSSNSSGVQAEVEKKIKDVAVPDGVTYYFEGETKAMSDGFSNMFIAIAVSVLLVYVVMMMAFGEMLAPFAILFSLPFIFVGAIGGLYLTGESLGMPALVGVLMLIGIVVTNAIVLIDRVMQNRNRGLATRESLIEAGVTRIRPILMTAVATIGALFPLAISTEGGLISRSLGIVVISGLSTSTLLTLVIVPIAYTVLDNIRAALFKGKKKDEIRVELEEAHV